MGSRNHEVVPTSLIASISGPGIGVHRCISNLAKINLIAKVKNAKYDGYRLTYGGLDYLALHTHTKSKTVFSVGNQIGVGKESDIFVCANEQGRQLVLKIHRLGRISFRTVKANRDYLRNRQGGSWMYMSRLAAIKEFEFMKALRREGFPVPEPVGQNRHTVIMGLIDAFPLRTISKVGDPAPLYSELLNFIVRFAQYGLIHGDFNEFNILIESPFLTAASATSPLPAPTPENTRMTAHLIDFPQITSMLHPSARVYFNRDVECIKTYFRKRYRFESADAGPTFEEAVARRRASVAAGKWVRGLDVEIEAAGFSRKMGKELEEAIDAERAVGAAADEDDRDEDTADDDEDDNSEDGGNEDQDIDAGLVNAIASSRFNDAQSHEYSAEATIASSRGDDIIQHSPEPVSPAATPLTTPLPNRPKDIAHRPKVRQSTKAVAGWAI